MRNTIGGITSFQPVTTFDSQVCYKEQHMEKMPQARRSGLIIQEVDSEVLIYDQHTDKAHCLNRQPQKFGSTATARPL